MRKIIFIFLILFAFGCSSKQKYKILNEDKFNNIKYSLDIEISKEIEEYEIRKIFNDIKDENPGYDLYFISFYLPNMIINSGAWATANYQNDLNIEIMGMSKVAVEQLSSRTFDNSIGVWKDNVMGVLIHLLKIDGNYFIRSEFDDGTFYDTSVVINTDELKLEISNSPSGDFYIIINNFLEIWDNDGKIRKYEYTGHRNRQSDRHTDRPGFDWANRGTGPSGGPLELARRASKSLPAETSSSRRSTRISWKSNGCGRL